MSRKALGRGLSALLRDAEAPASDLEQIPVTSIDPNPFQPRRTFPESEIKQLANSIAAAGVVQPVLVRRAGERYQLVAGERRVRAAQLAGLETIPAVVREVSDQEALELALTENMLREDLNPIEIARAYQSLQEKFDFTHEDIASRLGLDRSTVANTLRLLKLTPEVQAMIENRRLTSGHARALLGCSTAEGQLDLAGRIAKDGLSVRDAEKLTSSHRQAKPTKDPESTSTQADANLRSAVLELERSLGTRVRIVGDENRGRIEIAYYSAVDRDRLYEVLVRR